MRKGFTFIELLIVIAIIGIIGAVITGAIRGEAQQSVQERDQMTQEEILEQAQTSEPVYQPQNFLSRQAINRWTERMDNPDKLWYVYLMTESGAFIGYHVCNTVPLSYGVSITNPKQIVDERNFGDEEYVLPAPGVDGVFYSNTSSDTHYCFDAETDSLITFNTDFVYYDTPLDLQAPELNLKQN